MSTVDDLHRAVKLGDLPTLKRLLAQSAALANARSESDARGTYPLHVAAEFNQPAAAQLLVEHGADLTLLDLENDAIALCWAAFFGRPDVVEALIAAGSDVNQRNKHGLTPLGCAVGGTEGRWKQFSKATIDDWRRCADLITTAGGRE